MIIYIHFPKCIPLYKSPFILKGYPALRECSQNVLEMRKHSSSEVNRMLIQSCIAHGTFFLFKQFLNVTTCFRMSTFKSNIHLMFVK